MTKSGSSSGVGEGEGGAQIKDLLSASAFKPSLVHKSIDLLSASGFKPSLVLKSVDLLSDSGLRSSLVHKTKPVYSFAKSARHIFELRKNR